MSKDKTNRWNAPNKVIDQMTTITSKRKLQ